MAKIHVGYNARPSWIYKAVNIIEEREHVRRYHGRVNRPAIKRRTVYGAREEELEAFMDQLKFSLQEAIPEPNEDKIRRHIIDIDTKEFRNNGTAEDTFTISSQKKNEEQTKKTYRLMAGKSTSFGGEAGLNVGANFFNVGNFGVSAKGSISRTNTKEKTTEDEKTVSLTQEFGIVAELTAPPKTTLEVRITTFTVSYTTTVQVTAAIPVTASLRVMAPKTNFLGCTSDKFVLIGAKDFIKQYTGVSDNEVIQTQSHFIVTYPADLQYLGEVTKIDKLRELQIED